MKTSTETKSKMSTQVGTAFWIYLLAFVLMTWSFRAHSKEIKKVSAKFPVVVMSTSKGDIKIKLNDEKAPISTKNFLKYVDKKHYDGTIFHRVIKNFMIQGGGMTADMKEKTTMAPIENEAKNGLSNKRGTIAMARTDVVNSATAQFYINTVDNPMLDHKPDGNYGYAVFGEVVEGMDVVDKIREVAYEPRGEHQHVPIETVLIKSVRKGK